MTRVNKKLEQQSTSSIEFIAALCSPSLSSVLHHKEVGHILFGIGVDPTWLMQHPPAGHGNL